MKKLNIHPIRDSISRRKGFTLVEVLVAAVILFASVATVSLVYRGAFSSSQKADQYMKITGVLPSVLANIRDGLRAQGDVRQTQVKATDSAWDVTFSWQANLIEQKGAPQKMDVDTGDYIVPPLKYKLWSVDLTMRYKSTTKQYQFHEVSWTSE